jgi:hypothetical protein
MTNGYPKTALLFSAIAAVALVLVGIGGGEIKQSDELTKASIIGRCFGNGMKAVGKLIYVEDRRWGLLAFSSGVVGRYPFAALEPALCPGGDQPLDREHVLEILKKDSEEE